MRRLRNCNCLFQTYNYSASKENNKYTKIKDVLLSHCRKRGKDLPPDSTEAHFPKLTKMVNTAENRSCQYTSSIKETGIHSAF